jgi:hypothetical protein
VGLLTVLALFFFLGEFLSENLLAWPHHYRVVGSVVFLSCVLDLKGIWRFALKPRGKARHA